MKHTVTLTFAAFALASCAGGPEPDPGIDQISYGAPKPPPRWGAYETEQPQNASLWGNSPNALLSMRRAKDVGDLLTVVVEMNDQASLQSSLQASRDSSENFNIDALLGLPDWAGGLLPNGTTLSPAIDLDRQSDVNGSGAVNRAEQITFTLAARVVGVEQNGNLIIQGYQQTRVSNEIRYLTVSGVIRAQDITRTNTVSYDKIADASLSYISSGEATSQTGRRGAPKLLDKVLPF